MNMATVRIDKWLWAARFFKTRALAAQAVTGGKVHLNGARVKSSRAVRVGDRLSIRREIYVFDVEVLGLSERRGPAKHAVTLYCESEESIAARELMGEQNRINRELTTAPERRPDKKQRRQLRKVIRGKC